MVIASAWNLGNDGCNILIYIRCKHRLDNKDMVVTLNDLHHTEIIHITIPVEVQIGDHVGRVVDGTLKLGH